MAGFTPRPAHWERAQAAASDWHFYVLFSNLRVYQSNIRLPALLCGLNEKVFMTRFAPLLSRMVATGMKNWTTFYVAEGLHSVLVQVKPNLFPSAESCVATLNNLYPYVDDVSSDDMLKAIQQALTKDGKFPLTLVVLDEVQQYIGEDSQRSIAVQEAVEACCKNIGGKLLFIGTGQTAVTGTSNLKKLEGRFTIRVELSDADVDAVIRQVILAKKPEAKMPVEQIMQTNLGEISRHLAGTTMDTGRMTYPISPRIIPFCRCAVVFGKTRCGFWIRQARTVSSAISSA